MRPARALAFTVIALTLAWAGSALGTSSTISYQGKLTTSGGTPVADGSYAVTFTLWTDSVGGSLIWTELQDVHVTGGEGLFTCFLGNLQPLGGPLVIHADNDLYLQTAVSGEVLVPRLALGSVPRAFSASSVHHVEPGVGAMEMSVGDDTTRITVSHQGFSNLIDSYVHLTDDTGLLGLRLYDPALQYQVGDAVVVNDNIAQRTLGYDDDADGIAGVSVWEKVDNTEAVTEASIDVDDDGVADVGSSSSAKISRVVLKSFFQSGGTPNQSRVIDSVDGTGAYVSTESTGPDGTSSSNMKVRVNDLETKLQAIGLLASSSITNTLTPTTSGVAINTKGTGADKGRTIGGTCDDSSAVQVLEIDDDGDGIAEGRGIISVKSATGSGSMSASSRMTGDSDDDGMPETLAESAVSDKFAQVRGFKVEISGARSSFGDSADSAGVTSSLDRDSDGDGLVDFSSGGVVSDTSAQWGLSGPAEGPGNHRDGWNVICVDAETRQTLKSYFETGDIPTQDQVVDQSGSTFRAINTKGTGATVRVGMSATDSAASECVVDSDGDGTAESQANLAALLNGNVVIGALHDSDDDGLPENEASMVVTPTTSSMAINVKGTGADKNRTIGGTCDDSSATQTFTVDDDGDGHAEARAAVSSVSSLGGGGGGGAAASAYARMSTDSDDDGIPENDAEMIVTPTTSSVAINTKGTGADKNRVVGQTTDQDASMTVGNDAKSIGLYVNALTGQSSLTMTDNTLGTVDTGIVIDGATKRFGIGISQPTNPIEHSSGAKLTDGGVWTNASDANAKENFQPIDGEELLEKLDGLEITRWNYKADKSSEHIGPTAQEFKQIFGVGSDGKSISTIDPSGIALAAIKELNRQNRTLLEASADLAAQNRTLMEQNALLKQQMEELARKVERLAAAR